MILTSNVTKLATLALLATSIGTAIADNTATNSTNAGPVKAVEHANDHAAETPKTETPKTETPKTEAPKTETPKTEAPKTETPKSNGAINLGAENCADLKADVVNKNAKSCGDFKASCLNTMSSLKRAQQGMSWQNPRVRHLQRHQRRTYRRSDVW